MTITNFHLTALKSTCGEADLLVALRTLSKVNRPLYVGRCHHWIHAPHLSTDALTSASNRMHRWDYLIVHEASIQETLALPGGTSGPLAGLIERKWSITGNVDEGMLSGYGVAQERRASATVPSLPPGWNLKDHSGLDAAIPPSDVEASLALSSHPLGASDIDSATPVILKDFVQIFGTENDRPVDMMNLLSYHPGQRPRYFEYIAAFGASVGSRYGGDAMFLGVNVSDWSSKALEASTSQNTSAKEAWDDFALVHYPSIWHFGKMLDDPDYVDVDRRFKTGALRDNPILCCTEVEIEYKD